MDEKTNKKSYLKSLISSFVTGRGAESGWRYVIHNIYLFCILISKFFIEKRIHVRSAALSYYTSFAIIPLIAFTMAIARGFGFDSYVKDAIFYRFPSHTEMATMILEMVQRYLEHAQTNAFVGIGIAVLLWSVYRMFNQIERAFNDIWGIEVRRPIKSKIPNYIAIVFFIPVVILFTSAISFYFKYALQMFGDYVLVSPSLRLLLTVQPYFVSWLAFTLLYWFVPNTQVLFKYASVSGFIFSMAFMIFKEGYVYFQSWMTGYNAVYGTLAAIPLLMIFFQITWTLILLGCSFTFTSQCLRRFEHDEDVRNMSHRYFEFASLVITKICVDRMKNDDEYVTLYKLTQIMPYKMAKACADKLCRAKILDKVEISYGKYGYRPRPELSELTFNKFYLAIDNEGTELDNFSLHKNPRFAYLWKYVEDCRAKLSNSDSPLIATLQKDSDNLLPTCVENQDVKEEKHN